MKALLDLTRHSCKSLLDICFALCRNFKKRNIILPSQLFSLLSRDLPLLLHITFIPHKQLIHILRGKSKSYQLFICLLLNFLHPHPHAVKSLFFSHVIHDNNPMGSPIVARRKRPEPLLPRCVPLRFEMAKIRLTICNLMT